MSNEPLGHTVGRVMNKLEERGADLSEFGAKTADDIAQELTQERPPITKLLLTAADLIDRFDRGDIAQREGIELHTLAPGFEGENFTAILRGAVQAIDVFTWTCCGPCGVTFSGENATDFGIPHGEGCGDATCFGCLAKSGNICPNCKEPYTELAEPLLGPLTPEVKWTKPLTPCGPAADPQQKLLGTVEILGRSFHAEAYEIDRETEAGKQGEAETWLNEIVDIVQGTPEPVTINDRLYVLAITPCQV